MGTVEPVVSDGHDTETGGGSPPLILVVDDDPMTCLLAEESLRQKGFRTYTADSCRAAVDAVSQLRPAAVLLDAGLADGDGLKLCERLCRLGDFPVVLMIDARQAGAVEAAYRAGAADFVLKPVVWDLLGPRIRQLLCFWSAVVRQRHLAGQQRCLLGILNLPVAEMPLETWLRRALEHVVRLPWMDAAVGGAVFLREGAVFRLAAQIEPPSGIPVSEARFSLDCCPCTRDQSGQRVHFVTMNHPRDQVTTPGMPDRRFCHVPLVSGDRMLGVMVLTCPARWEWGEAQLQFLAALGRVIAAQIERKRTDRKLTLTLSAFEGSLDAAVIVDERMTIVEVNRTFTELTGLTADEAQGRSLRLLQPVAGESPKECGRHFIKQLAERRAWEGEVWLRRKDGTRFLSWMQVVRSAVDESDDQFYILTFADISERKREAEDIRRLAFYDQLTGLCNRSLLMDRLTLECRRAARNGTALAVLFFDLDRFKAINDVLGHDQGDALLTEVARRVQGVVRKEDTVARLGGDEFVVVLAGLDAAVSEARKQAARIAEKIIEAIRRPCRLAGRELVTSASIGIAIGLSDEREAEGLLKLADLAMYAAKKEGRDCYRFYQPHMSQVQVRRLNLQERMRRALAREALTVHLQPRLRIADRALVGAEALVRWWDEEGGHWIPPEEFIPLAEETGLIDPLYEWLLERICRYRERWRQAGLGAGLRRIAVNVSPRQFQQRNFARRTIDLTVPMTCGQGPALELEVTEAALMRYPQESHRTLSLLKEAGIGIAIDDFGTGYSNMVQLQRFPIDLLKIDRSLVSTCPKDAGDTAIVRVIVSMARELRLAVVAEGVEAADQLEFLRRLGCDYYQGYLCAPALTPEEFEAFLRNVS